MKKTCALLLSICVILLLSSCFGTDYGTVEISATQTESVSRDIYVIPEYNVDETQIKQQFRGEPAFSLTPNSFILDIDEIELFNPRDPDDMTKGVIDSFKLVEPYSLKGGWILPKRYNMLTSKGVSSITLPLSIIRKKWHGMMIAVRPGGNEETNGMWAGSIIGVSKDAITDKEINVDDVVNDMDPSMVGSFNIQYSDDYLWFSFCDIYPYSSSSDPNNSYAQDTYLFVDSVDSVSFLNPEMENGSWIFGPRHTSGNASCAIMPMKTIDLRDMITPTIVISVDTENMLDFYLYNGKYYASARKTNPLPLRIYVDEYDPDVYLYTEQAVNDIDNAAPFDCFDYNLTITDNNSFQHVLTYTTANYAKLSYVEIYRSTDNSFEESDTLVYRGTRISTVDYEPAPEDEVYYFIRTVNLSGDKSNPKLMQKIVSSFTPYQ